jgi:hypothetical protein
MKEPELARTLGHQARERAIKRHNPDLIIDRLQEIYSFILKNGKLSTANFQIQ